MRPLQRPSAPLCLWDPSAVCRRSYIKSTSLLATLCTPERQSLCESHRQRRWLTYWSKRGIQPRHARKLADLLDRLHATTRVEDMRYPGSDLHPLSPTFKGSECPYRFF